MIWSIPATLDTTIYESDPYRNTGLDPVIELSKLGDTSTNDLTESRILIKFDITDLNSILSTNGISITDITASIQLYAVQSYALPKTYTIEARPISVPWDNGSGYFVYPEAAQTNASITDGATWITTAGTGSISWTGSLSTGAAMLFNSSSTIGGGTWYTSSVASQSFSFKSSDSVSINVTNIVRSWYTGSLSNNGFILAFNHNSITASNYPETRIEFYSSDTTSVLEPQLYISWSPGVSYSTGSLTVATTTDNPIVYVNNFNAVFKKDQKVRIRIAARKKFPRPAFAQNSVFSDVLALPANSYYRIKDAHTNLILIDYSENTKISADSNGNYFDFYATMMYPERFYMFEIKSEYLDATRYYDAKEFTFKIVN